MGHASHTEWRAAAYEVVQQLRAQMASPAHASRSRLGLIYCSHSYAPHAVALLNYLSQALPQVHDWSGCSAAGVLAQDREYSRQPALAVMLLDLPAAHYRIYSGLLPLGMLGDEAGFTAQTALVHADAQIPELPEVLQELSQRTSCGQLLGGVSSGEETGVQFALRAEEYRAQQAGASAGVLHGGLSGVAWSGEVATVTRMAQACVPLLAPLTITGTIGNLVTELDGKPALPWLLKALELSEGTDWHAALGKVRSTMVAIAPAGRAMFHAGLGPHAQVRSMMGLDPRQQAIALAAPVQIGESLIFCRRDAKTARQGVLQMGAALRDALSSEQITQTSNIDTSMDHPWLGSSGMPEPSRIRGAIYISCRGRGGGLFGGEHAELKTLRHALGKVPVIGFQAESEIMHGKLQRFASVLTVFTEPH